MLNSALHAPVSRRVPFETLHILAKETTATNYEDSIEANHAIQKAGLESIPKHVGGLRMSIMDII